MFFLKIKKLINIYEYGLIIFYKNKKILINIYV
jgi:hypothetical protein